MELVRVDPERLEGLPGYDLTRRSLEIGGLRQLFVDEGDGEPVLLVHGEPTWSYLWRKVIPPLRAAGYRCIAPDLIGFGGSDKPTDISFYTYDRLCASLGALVEALELQGATIVVHDWGGPIGLRVAVEHAERFARIVIMDTGLFTGRQRMSEAWLAFRDFVARTEDLPIGLLVARGCASEPPAEVVAAYEAPFPSPAAKAGARALPLLIPLSEDAPGAAAGRAVLDALRVDSRPKLMLWADADPVLPARTGAAFAQALGLEPPLPIAGAGHFLQEDRGEEIGARIAEWLSDRRGR
ncbi:MAG TPA: haloalkane dehalogenase [Solirubrobacteraceae bacterium]|nr:haloalkane dehalogenase [Solirubrobacteraceae bacterium]